MNISEELGICCITKMKWLDRFHVKTILQMRVLDLHSFVLFFQNPAIMKMFGARVFLKI